MFIKTNILFFILVQIGLIMASCRHKQEKTNATSNFSSNDAKNIDDSIRYQSDNFSNFNHFIKRFSTDSVFQVEHIIFPLKITTLIDPVDETYNEDLMEIVDFSFIDLPITEEDNPVDGYYTIISHKQADKILVILRHIDMGIHIEYIFTLHQNKWFLKEMRDEST
jgi:hypothetical protein